MCEWCEKIAWEKEWVRDIKERLVDLDGRRREFLALAKKNGRRGYAVDEATQIDDRGIYYFRHGGPGYSWVPEKQVEFSAGAEIASMESFRLKYCKDQKTKKDRVMIALDNLYKVVEDL